MSNKYFTVKTADGGIKTGYTLAGDLRTLEKQVKEEEYLWLVTRASDPAFDGQTYYISTKHIVWIKEATPEEG